MTAIDVSVINASDAVSDADCRALTDALQVQVSRDFAPAWHIDANLTFVPKAQKPAAGTWWLSILDNTDRAGVLGHHDLTPDGLPIGKSFAGTDKHYGFEWTVTASHELLEMLANPDVNLAVLVHPDHGDSKLYAYEVCDPCEDDAHAYSIDGIKVCNFVYPAYFQTFRLPGSARFDHQGKLTAPVPALLPGGYISTFDVNDTAGWQHLAAATSDTGMLARAAAPGRVSSRRERRQRPRANWQCSTAFQ
ncbi:MAG TPA: hypothetical protein VH855_23080 [Acetobacteraceae bacterium]|jgi:hypothetical protein